MLRQSSTPYTLLDMGSARPQDKRTSGLATALTLPIDRLLTAAEVADALAVSRRRVYALTEAGLLPCYRVGASLRFGAADVLAMLEAARQTGGEWRAW